MRQLEYRRMKETIRHNQLTMRIAEPTSSWDIMEWVIQRAKEEPRRMWMGTWGTFCFGEGPDEPPCGTAACFSGWSNVRMVGSLYLGDIGRGTADILAGVGEEQGAEDGEGLALRMALYNELFVADDLMSMSAGTPEMVEAVEKRAREIMVRFEKRLKSVIIHPGGKFTRMIEQG